MRAASHHSKTLLGCLRKLKKRGRRKQRNRTCTSFFSGENIGFDRAERRRGSDFVGKIVSFANPISCQLNPALWNILKSTQSAGGGEGGNDGRGREKVRAKVKDGGSEMEIGHN